jgi:hypothetical protein
MGPTDLTPLILIAKEAAVAMMSSRVQEGGGSTAKHILTIYQDRLGTELWRLYIAKCEENRK